MSAPHPAKFSSPILLELTSTLKSILPPGARILDPFAGVGGIHCLQPWFTTVGVELELEWAVAHPDTIWGNSLELTTIFADEPPFDAIATSPAYGNRMADHHEAKDDSKRNTYRHILGRPLSPDSTAGEQWGERYRDLHSRVWDQMPSLLVPNGFFVLNISDHIRKGVVVEVTKWHVEYLLSLGFAQVEWKTIKTNRQRFGAHGALRVEHESLITFQHKGTV